MAFFRIGVNASKLQKRESSENNHKGIVKPLDCAESQAIYVKSFNWMLPVNLKFTNNKFYREHNDAGDIFYITERGGHSLFI